MSAPSITVLGDWPEALNKEQAEQYIGGEWLLNEILDRKLAAPFSTGPKRWRIRRDSLKAAIIILENEATP